MMAPSDRQQKMLLELVVKCIVPTVCAALQIHFILMVAILLQHQKVKQEADLAIQEKNHALRRYRQLRNRFLRSKRRNWKNPGRTDEWWRNLMVLSAMMLLLWSETVKRRCECESQNGRPK